MLETAKLSLYVATLEAILSKTNNPYGDIHKICQLCTAIDFLTPWITEVAKRNTFDGPAYCNEGRVLFSTSFWQ